MQTNQTIKEIGNQIEALKNLAVGIRNGIDSRITKRDFYFCNLCNKPLFSPDAIRHEDPKVLNFDYDKAKLFLNKHECQE